MLLVLFVLFFVLLLVGCLGNGKGRTALHKAVEHKNMHAILYLIDELGSNINAQDKSGDTSLHLAASRGFTEVVEVLLERGAYTTIANSAGKLAQELVSGNSTMKDALNAKFEAGGVQQSIAQTICAQNNFSSNTIAQSKYDCIWLSQARRKQ